MTTVEVSQEAAKKLEALSEQTDKTVDEVLLWLLDHYGQTLLPEPDLTDVVWTEEELAELMQPATPLTGKEIAEAGLLGGWKDMGIEDSLEWVQELRAKRRKKHQW